MHNTSEKFCQTKTFIEKLLVLKERKFIQLKTSTEISTTTNRIDIDKYIKTSIYFWKENVYRKMKINTQTSTYTNLCNQNYSNEFHNQINNKRRKKFTREIPLIF